MANEATSRHTTPTLRWGETASQVPDATNVVEPSGGKKDTGWRPGLDPNVAEWTNWLAWSAGVFNRYIENSRELLWSRNHVMAGAADTEGVVTDGVGLSIDITFARVWIDGKMQRVPAVTNLALAAADPTDDRIDLVIAEVVASIPQYSVVTGTPDPFPEVPALPAGAVAICEVRVDAADTTPGGKTDRRLFGAMNQDLLRANKKLIAGDMGAQVFFLLEPIGAFWQLKIGGSNDPIAQFSDFGDQFLIKAESLRFFDPIVRKYDIDATDFKAYSDDVAVGDPASSYMNSVGNQLLETNNIVFAPVRIPNGATITAVRVYGTRNVTTEGVEVQLERVLKTTGARTDLLPTSPATSNEGDPTGDFVLAVEGLSVAVDQTDTYRLWIRGTGTGGPTVVFSAEVEYTQVVPFDSL